MIHFNLIINRSGRVRYGKWYSQYSEAEKHKIIDEVYLGVATRLTNSMNVFEFHDYKIVYKKYSSVYFISCIDVIDNELANLEFIHNMVELFNVYFENVCELDLVFNFIKVYQAYDAAICAGEIREVGQSRLLAILKGIERLD
uniref:AP complex subunit sigma n=1 Tax=Henneguya salminicola TaxID=69463 RepID=A0A6G3MLG8_HENSL